MFSGYANADTLRLQLVDLAGAPIVDAVVEYDAKPLEPTLLVTNDYIMDQADFQFSPRVLVVPVGALVRFPNSDESRHHVYSFSEARPFELKLYAGNQSEPIDFENPGPVALGCNIHDRMNAHIYVTESDIALVSDEKGQVSLPAVTQISGRNLKIWHPLLKVAVNQLLTNLTENKDGFLLVSLPLLLPQVEASETANSLRNRLKSFKTDGY